MTISYERSNKKDYISPHEIFQIHKPKRYIEDIRIDKLKFSIVKQMFRFALIGNDRETPTSSLPKRS